MVPTCLWTGTRPGVSFQGPLSSSPPRGSQGVECLVGPGAQGLINTCGAWSTGVELGAGHPSAGSGLATGAQWPLL